MHRYATAPRSTFEELFDQAREGVVTLAGAAYPPVCGNRGGEVSLSLGRTGAMIVHVDPGECRADEFRLRLLFETGTCVFSTPSELCSFWTGPLAEAFGIAPAEPTAEPAGSADTDADMVGIATLPPDASTTAEPAFAQDEPAVAVATAAAPAPTSKRLARELARVIHGQGPALERVASATISQLAKRHPARPGSVLLLGPAGAGKTTTIEALPHALATVGFEGANVFRIDCGELTDSIQVTRLLGSPPGYSGHAATTPLLNALELPRCILLVDEVDRAHPDVLDTLLGLLDAGRLTGPSGTTVDARHVVVAMTTSAGSDELAGSLGRTPLEDRWAVHRTCAEHLRRVGLGSDLIGRIGAFAAFAAIDGEEARRGIAEAAVQALGREYGLVVATVEPTVLDVVEDIARDTGDLGSARALQHAARELLAEAFSAVAGDGPRRRVEVEAGPPVAVRLLLLQPVHREG